jgi:hypothetical protein
MVPPASVLETFDIRGKTIRLPGGQGRTFRVGEMVLKQTQNKVETIWVIEILNGLEISGL